MLKKCLIDVSHTDMMTPEQARIVKMVYSRFIKSEEDGWSEIDNNLEFFSFLTDGETILEAQIKFLRHSKGTFRCFQEHSSEECVAPLILEAVGIILELYEINRMLHEKNRYILTYYLAMSELGLIFSVTSSAV